MNGRREWRKILFAVLRPPLRVIARVFWGAKTEVRRDIRGPYVVLGNHSYLIDALMMGITFVEPLHFVAASATIRSSRWGRVLRALTGIIEIDKSGMDVRSVRRMIKEVKLGHSIGLYPEGNTTIDGSMLPIGIATAKLIKKLECKVVLFRTVHGYDKKPKWAWRYCRGTVQGDVVRVIEAEELADMSAERLLDEIVKGLHCDAAEERRRNPVAYVGKRKAEGIERLLYRCPECGEVGQFASAGTRFWCKACGHNYGIEADGRLWGSRFDNTADWNKWQLQKEKERLALLSAQDMWYAVPGTLWDCQEKRSVNTGVLRMWKDRLEIGARCVPYDELRGCVLHGCNGILWTQNDRQFRFVPNDMHANVIPLVTALEGQLRK